MTSVLLVGAGGTLGSALATELSRVFETVALGRERLDVTRRDDVVAEVASRRPDVVVNASGYTAVDRAEDEPDAAAAVNDRGVRHLAEAAAAVGATLVHVSTDYVFDGRKGAPYDEDDPTSPLGAYGRTKLAGERHVRAWPRHLLVRTQGVFAAGRPCFPESILAAAEAGGPVRVASDVVTGIAYAPDVARAIRRLLESGARGLFHVANAGAVAWADVARAVLDACGRRGVEVERVPSESVGRRARRPRWSYLSSARAVAAIGEPMPPWRDAVARFAAARAAAVAEGRS